MALQIILSHNTLLKKSLKLVSAIFHFCTKWQPLDNSEKCFLLYLKSSFRSQDIQIFVFLSSLSISCSHWLRGWLKINLKNYGVSNCLNQNLITILLDILRRKKDMTLNFANWLSNKEYFYGKNHAENVHHNQVAEPFLVLVNNAKQPLHARNCFKNKKFWKRIIKKP